MARRAVNGRGGGGEAVTWRDGVHITGTSIWCDARRARDVCFVSAPDRIVRASHGQLIATRETLVVLGSAADDARSAHLAVPYGRPFTLGAIRLELVPTGHGLGAAGLWVDHAGTRVLYAGAIASGRHVGLGAPAELRTCDALVVDAPYGAPEHRFPPAPEAAAATVAWVQQAVGAGTTAAVLVTSASKGLDVAAELARAGLEVVAHRAIHHASQRLHAAGLAPDGLAIRGVGRAGRTSGAMASIDVTGAVTPAPSLRPAALLAGKAVVWLVHDRARLDALAPPATRATALVSGLASEPATVAALGLDAAFAWSNAADRDGLLALIRASGARSIYVTGRCAPAIVAELGGAARALGPPQQMALFGESTGESTGEATGDAGEEPTR
jgi:putative mRNA 3-end processing factor